MIVKVNGVEMKQEGTNAFAFVEDTRDFMGFINDIRDHGLSHAIYGKPFSQVLKEGLIDTMYKIGEFIANNADLFFLFPAIILMFITFLVGRNQYTKWILPFWFTYAITTFFGKMI